MANSIVMKSFYAGVAAFVLCMISATAGGMTWGATVAGWVVFFSVVLSVAVGIGAFCWQVELAAQKWQHERRDVIDRMEDAQKCIKAEEQAHGRTRQELISVRQQLTTAEFDASAAKREFENMSERAGQRGREVAEIREQWGKDRDELIQTFEAEQVTWRKQVSNMRNAALNLYCALDTMKFNNDDLDAVQNLMDGLRALAEAGGVQEVDERQLAMPIETVSADAWATPAKTFDVAKRIEFEGVPLPEAQTQPTPLHIAHQLMAKVRGNQAVRRDNLDRLCKAIEDGYELGEAITATYHRGALCVTDDMIANEIAAVKAWEVGQRHAEKGWHK